MTEISVQALLEEQDGSHDVAVFETNMNIRCKQANQIENVTENTGAEKPRRRRGECNFAH